MDYYNSNSAYYQSDITNSPRQQQSCYSYDSNYRYSQQGRYNNRSRRNSSRVHSMVDHTPYYNNEEYPRSPHSSSQYDRPLTNNYYRSQSSYFKNEDDNLSSSYYTASPSDYYYQQQCEEKIYTSPSNSNRRTRINERKHKYHDYPITPEEGRSVIYNNEEEASNAGDNETYVSKNIDNTGAVTLTSAYDQYNSIEKEIYHEEEDEEDEEDPTTQRNTMLNSESSVMINSNHSSPHESFTGSTMLNTPQQLTVSNIDQQQQQQQKKTWFKNVVNSAILFKRKVKTFRKRDSIIEQNSLLHEQQHHPAIQFVTAANNELLGDVLDAQQEKEILSQLSTPNLSTASSFNMPLDKTKITNLDRIWVFRLIDSNQPPPESNTSVAWLGFDYENQIAIENHLKEVSNLPENEKFAVFYDSHIRYGKMPVIVTPSESKGYYFANEEQTELIMLQVTYIENNHDKFSIYIMPLNTLTLLSLDIRETFEGDKFLTALSWLPDVERPSVTRFKFERDQHLALGSLLLRRHYFSELLKVPWLELEFDRHLPGGKPFLKGQSNIDYNISHEGNWVIFGVSFSMLIGIDTVVIDRTLVARADNNSIDSFVKSFNSQLTQNEMQLIEQSEDQLQTFFELWGCKESYIKAVGVGLALELNKLDFMNKDNQIRMNFEGKKSNSWCFHLSYLDEKSIAVICCGYKDNQKVLDSQITDFSKTTKLLGSHSNKDPLHVFHQVKFHDIQNNKWLSRS